MGILRDLAELLFPALLEGGKAYARAKGVDVPSLRAAVRNTIDSEIRDEDAATAVTRSLEILLEPVYLRLEELERAQSARQKRSD